MFALAFVSVVSGSDAMKPIHRMLQEIQHIRRRLPGDETNSDIIQDGDITGNKDPRYWKNGQFEANLEDGTWKLKRRGMISNKDTSPCGEVTPPLLDQWAIHQTTTQGDRQYYPLGCALKASKSSAYKNKFENEKARWFMFEIREVEMNGLVKLDHYIHYYEPTEDSPQSSAKDCLTPKDSVRIVDADPRPGSLLTNFKKNGTIYDFAYPTLTFTVIPGNNQKNQKLKLAFRKLGDANLFANTFRACKRALQTGFLTRMYEKFSEPAKMTGQAPAEEKLEETPEDVHDAVEEELVPDKPQPVTNAFQAIQQMWQNGVTQERLDNLHKMAEYEDWIGNPTATKGKGGNKSANTKPDGSTNWTKPSVAGGYGNEI